MTNLLRKIFIKNYQNTDNPQIRQKHGFLASFVGVFTNFLLFVFKLLIGVVTASVSIIADAINNLTDMASCIINLVGFKLAGKPADKEHPYGHERIEYISGMIISFVIVSIAVVLGYESIQKIINNEGSDPSIITFIILGAAILVKLWQSLFYKNIANAINSVSLKASSQDSINDVISTGVVLIASVLEFVLKNNNVTVKISIDGIMGLIVAIFILIMGIKTIMETADPLIGITPDNELVKEIAHDICSYDGILGIHDVMVHSYGPTTIFMTAHAEVDASVDVLISHDIIDNIETELGKKYNMMLTIHMDPIETKSEEINALKDKTKIMLEELDQTLTFHDFRIVVGNTHTNVIFDVVVPFDYKHDDLYVINYLKDKYKEINTKYNLVIKVDRDYVTGK